jgi:hypothetical protein
MERKDNQIAVSHKHIFETYDNKFLKEKEG